MAFKMKGPSLYMKSLDKAPLKETEDEALNTKQTQRSLTRREINKKLKDEKKFQKQQQDQNKTYYTGGNKTKVPNIFSSRAEKEKYLNARDEKAKDKRKEAISRENYKKYTDAGIDPATMKPIN